MTSIVVPSFDSYRDLWPLWFQSFKRAWPDCPYPVYFITNGAAVPDPSVYAVNVGEDRGWSDNLIKALPEIPGDTILLLLEDLFLADRINTPQLTKVISWAETNRVSYLKLQPLLPFHSRFSADIYELREEEPYWTSTVTSLWRRDVLASLLVKGESAWDFEIKGTERAKGLGDSGFYATTARHIPIINGVIRRVWNPSSIRALRKLRLEPDLRTRAVMTPQAHSLWAVKALLFNIWFSAESLKTLFKKRTLVKLSPTAGMDKPNPTS